MKVAIVHDYLNQYGGAERVLEELKAIYPDADVKTAIYDPACVPDHYRDWKIQTSWINKLPLSSRRHRWWLPLYPLAFESIDLTGYDLVLTSSSGFAHGVIVRPDTCNICYCHSPPRFIWDFSNYASRESLGRMRQALIAICLPRLRAWDRRSSERTTAWISTSRLVSDRIAKCYARESTLIPPPIKTDRFEVGTGERKHYLMLMRLVGWKRPDIVVEACTRLRLPLVVAGDGRELARLRRMAGPTVRFVGHVNDEQMRCLYRDCKALILPSEEDFGITPLEAMASGRPVIAFGAGGVLDTVIPGVTGIFFEEQNAESLMSALNSFDSAAFDARTIREHAELFDSRVFRRRIREFVERQMARRLPTADVPKLSPVIA